MKEVSGLLLGVCFAAVLGGVVHLLSPKGSTERIMTLLVALFVLCSVLAPLKNISRLHLKNGWSETPTANIGQAVLDSAEAAIRQTVQTILRTYGEDGFAEIEMEERDGEAHTKRFVIYGVGQKNAQEVANAITEHTGETPIMVERECPASEG